ncbi:MAG: heavy-metal-associated domain-containing protein [Methylotenera sp.]|jgi:copper chaperone|nr:heavy-metal-associated domain-containing protein [Methylotenera sp.]
MHRFTLPDMSCGHCVAAITEALKAADAQAHIEIDREARTAAVESALPREALVSTLTQAGYPPEPAAA